MIQVQKSFYTYRWLIFLNVLQSSKSLKFEYNTKIKGILFKF